MMADQAQKLRELAGETVRSRSIGQRRRGAATGTRCRSIAVTSGKGGVGKSNVSLSLAVALSRAGRKVLLFDADLGLANIHILLGLTPKRNLYHVVRGECTLDEALCEGPAGITILPGSSGVAAMANLEATRLEELRCALSAIEERFDFVIIDGGAGIGAGTMQVASSADMTLLVLTPEPTALADVYATAKILISRGVRDLRVLVNMAAGAREGKEIFAKLRDLVRTFLHRELRLSAIIPLDRDVPRLVRMQKNPVISKPSSRFAVAVTSCARTLCGMPPARGGFFARLVGSAVRWEGADGMRDDGLPVEETKRR
jgi:flagellar biosynthesis protein FlhG